MSFLKSEDFARLQALGTEVVELRELARVQSERISHLESRNRSLQNELAQQTREYELGRNAVEAESVDDRLPLEPGISPLNNVAAWRKGQLGL